MAVLLPKSHQSLTHTAERELALGQRSARLLPEHPDKTAPQGPEGAIAAAPRATASVSEALIDAMLEIGTRHAFGVIGGAVVAFYDAMAGSELSLVNCRHESGAVFAALEASLAADAPAIAFTTSGPGLTNALTGAATARWEGAKLLLISGHSPAARRGRYALQEQRDNTGFYESDGLFDFALALEAPEQMPQVLRALARGFASRRGFVAHLALPLPLQSRPCPPVGLTVPAMDVAASPTTVTEVRGRLRERFAIWVGYGARHAGPAIAKLAARTGAPVLATPRGKGIFPEDHPRYLGVSGAFGSDPQLAARLRASGAERLLVLGTRLGEFSSSYDHGLMPRGGLIHVDLDPTVPGAAFPQVETLAVQAEVGLFVSALLDGELACPPPLELPPRPRPPQLTPDPDRPQIRPQLLMQAIQSRVVEGSRSVVMAESGNAFAWTTQLLRFPTAHRYRQSGLFCPMGQVSAGLLGTAAATGERAVAVVGDGAFLMQNEVSTAAQTGADVTWIVLNDARYGMVDQGLAALGYPPAQMSFPEVDFPSLGRSLGIDGLQVTRETELEAALDHAMSVRGPFVLDVRIDPREPAPFGQRLRSLDDQTHEHSAGEGSGGQR